MSAVEYLNELNQEKNDLSTICSDRFYHAIRLLEDEISRVSIKENIEIANIYPPASNEPAYTKPTYLEFPDNYEEDELYEDVVELHEKVIVPVNMYPNYNFIGKLLGPKGNTLKSIESSSKTKISILGKGSTRDRKKEEELIASLQPKYEHLMEPLHILIKSRAPKSQAHAQISDALDEVQKYMVPERHDSYKYKRSLSPYQDETVQLSEKFVLPTELFPRYNFVGKLLGHKGNTLKDLQSSTKTKMAIFGRGSTREKEKEAVLIRSNDSKYNHLREPLHVLIQVEGQRSEAHRRIAAAINEIKECINLDNIRIETDDDYSKDCDSRRNNCMAQNIPEPLRVGRSRSLLDGPKSLLDRPGSLLDRPRSISRPRSLLDTPFIPAGRGTILGTRRNIQQ